MHRLQFGYGWKITQIEKPSNANGLFLGLKLSACVLDRIGLSIFLEVGLSIAVDSEIGQNGLIRSGLGLSYIGHLNSFLSELPFVPAVIRVDVFLDKVNRRLYALV